MLAPSWRKSSYSSLNGNCTQVRFATSSRCNGGTCTEAAVCRHGAQVRDSKMAPRDGCEGPSGPVLEFGAGDWRAFLAAVRDGTLETALR